MKNPKHAGEIVPLQTRAVAKPKASTWRQFNRFIRDMDELVEYHEGLEKLFYQDPDRTVDELEDEAVFCQELVERCKRGLARFDREESYELDDEDGDRVLCHDHIAKRIGVLIASLPNVNPADPAGYLRMLVEHVGAVKDLTEVALESACREIAEKQKFAPTLPEILPVIDKHIKLWWKRRFAIKNAEATRLSAIKALRERERKKKQDQRDAMIKSATYAVKFAMEATQRRKREIAVKEEELASLRAQLARAEQTESELLRRLRQVTASEEEQAAAAAAKVNGHGCGELPLEPTVH